MKYLLFNVAVAAALVFLFTADRGDVQKIAGRIHDAAGDMKAYANKALKTGETLLGREARRDTEKTGRKTEPASVAAPLQSMTQPAKQTVTQPVAQPVPKPSAPPVVTRPEPPTKPQSEPPLPHRLARNLPEMPETGKAAPVDLDPAVAKRRREVLNGIDAADSAPVLNEGTRLMTPSERRKELLSLAEEMELLYARSISR